MPAILKENENYVVFRDFSGNDYLYERLFGSIHRYNPDLEKKFSHIKVNTSFNFSLDEIVNHVAESNFVLLNVTEDCNLRCKYCIYSGEYKGQRLRTQEVMRTDTAFKAVDFMLGKDNVDDFFVGFYGGEPLENFGLIQEVIGYINKKYPSKHVKYSMTTNGTLLDEVSDFIIDNNFLLNVSLDGPKSVHDRWRTFGKKGSFDVIYSNLEEIKAKNSEYYKNVTFSATIVDTSHLLDILHFFDNDPLTKNHLVSVNPLERRLLKDQDKFPQTNAQDSQVADLANEYIRQMSLGPSVSPFLSGAFDLQLKKIWNRCRHRLSAVERPGGACIPGGRRLFVDTGGNFYACERVGRNGSIGSVDEGLRLDNIKDLLVTYLNIRNSSCTSCWSSRLCGVCISNLTSDTGFSEDSLDQICRHNKNSVITSLSIHTILVEQELENYAKYMNNIQLE